MRLNDKELEKVICFKVGKFFGEELEKEDFEELEELNINNRNFSGKYKNISLQELTLFPNIKRLSLQYFEIDDSLVEVLNKLENLESLEFASCGFFQNAQLRNNSLNSLLLNCCKVKDYNKIFAPENFTIIGDENIRLDQIDGKENVRKMYLQDSKVKNFGKIEKYENLEKLNLDGSIVDNKDMLEEVKKRISVSQLEKYEPIR